MQIQLHQSVAVQPDILKFSLVGDVTLVNDLLPSGYGFINLVSMNPVSVVCMKKIYQRIDTKMIEVSRNYCQEVCSDCISNPM